MFSLGYWCHLDALETIKMKTDVIKSCWKQVKDRKL